MDATRDPIILKVRRDRMRQAEAAVAKAKRRVNRAEAKMQIALDERNEADEALSEANHNLGLVRLDQEIWKRNG